MRGRKGGGVQSLFVSRQQGSVCVRVLSKHRIWHNMTFRMGTDPKQFSGVNVHELEMPILQHLDVHVLGDKKKSINITFDKQTQTGEQKPKTMDKTGLEQGVPYITLMPRRHRSGKAWWSV